jgi:hypothetical protein
VDDMITGDWAGVTADLVNQIKTMLQQNGVESKNRKKS